MKGERPSSAPPRRKVGKRGRPSNGEIENRKREIIVAARRVFAHKGYVDATVKDIAQAAGVGKKTIYEHIGDKAELFRVAYGTSTSKVGLNQFELPRGTCSARAALKNLARQVLEDALHTDNIALERALMRESTRFPELAQDVIRSAKTQSRRKLATALDEMVKRGLLVSADTTRAATYFFAIVAASDALKAIQGYRNTFPDDVELDSRVDMFLYGYPGKKRSSP